MSEWNDTIHNILTMRDKPDAFFAICDSHALKFIKKASAVDIKIPDDIALVGMDNIEMCKYMHPSLTTVHIPFNKIFFKFI